MSKTTFIGIDPDVTKSGVALKNGKEFELFNKTFFELFEFLKLQKQEAEIINKKLIVVIECGFLNKSNWHKKVNGSASMNSKIGERTGANFETAKKICEMCEYLQIDFRQIRPTKSKVNAAFFSQITGYKKRSNQEQRDAYMLIHGL
ncbi:hypothetical protein K5I29_04125 [Flavobacterium agricola]|uniref:Holliday junction resolvase RuvC n=1 Tax=Flavobacterium agricola TaxID=2870839 RepID=A0ABY6M0P6_9FLAO|nr:hypothetical protein [Flavobacterium agricola]UYW02096.1 hypothetical protein K5I29_04125 [Flavobacterium agricola]